MSTSTLERPLKPAVEYTRARTNRRARTSIPTTHHIKIMGVLGIDTTPARNTKPLEFVTALVLAGGRMGRDALVRRLYLSTACDSAVPTLCYRARKMGIDVSYDCSTATYVLRSEVRVDALTILELLREGDVRSALGLWNPWMYKTALGPHSPFTPLNTESNQNTNLYYTGSQDSVYNPATGLGTPKSTKLAKQFP